MELEKLDKNFSAPQIKDADDVEWFDAQSIPFEIYGVQFDSDTSEFRRIPARLCENMRPQIKELAAQTAGGRVRFITDSPYVAISCVTENDGLVSRFTIAGVYGCSLYSDREFRGIVAPGWKELLNTEGSVRYSGSRAILKSGEHDTLICLPLYAKVKQLYIGLKRGSILKAPPSYKYDRPVLFYGSSITQGGCASRPGNDYVGLLSRMLDTDVLNLGFSGNAKGEMPMAEYLASLSPSVYVIDYDHNAPTVEHLKNTHYRLYETIRNAHESTPIIFISRPDFESGEDSVGLRAVIRQTYELARDNGDKNVSFIDGEALFGECDREACTVDTRHPNDIGFYRMAEYIAPILKKQLDISYEK